MSRILTVERYNHKRVSLLYIYLLPTTGIFIHTFLHHHPPHSLLPEQNTHSRKIYSHKSVKLSLLYLYLLQTTGIFIYTFLHHHPHSFVPEQNTHSRKIESQVCIPYSTYTYCRPLASSSTLFFIIILIAFYLSRILTVERQSHNSV